MNSSSISSVAEEKKSIKFKPIKFIPLNPTQKEPRYPLKKTKLLKADIIRECNRSGMTNEPAHAILLDAKKYKMAFMLVRSYADYLKSNKPARRIYINEVIANINFNLMSTDADDYLILGIRRLNRWFKELIIYLIWKTDGRALKNLWCKLDFPSIELLLKLQVGLRPRNAEENTQIQKVKDILCERQNQLLNISGLCPDVIKMICRY
jgi:hypothetical protein